MIFTDDDLKRLEDMTIDPRKESIVRNIVIQALLARLEAAEICLMDEFECGHYNSALFIAWRKAAGKE